MRTEKTLGIIALIGFFFLLMDFPGGSLILIASLGTLGLLYMLFAFYLFCDKKLKRQKLALSIVSGYFLSAIPLGILFKLLGYPGGYALLLSGTISAPAYLLIAFLLKRKAKEELTIYYRNMLVRTSALTVLVIFFCFIPSTTFWKIQHRNDSELLEVRIKYHEGRSDEHWQDFRRRRDSLRFEEWKLQGIEQQQSENEIE